MPIEILMPALSPTMTEGNLAKWHIKEGDKVTSGKVIAEIETDKATMEVEAVDEGVVGKILVPEGTEGVLVNNVIALLLKEGEDKKAVESYKPANDSKKESGVGSRESGKDTDAKKDAAPSPIPPGEGQGEDVKPPQPTQAPTKAPQPSRAPSTINHQPSTAGKRVAASPLARRVANENNLDLSLVRGSGPKGRIVAADVHEALERGVPGGVVRRDPTEFITLKNSGMRKVIARRLLESKQQVPHFYLAVDCELDALLDVRKQLNDKAEKQAGKDATPAYKLSVNDLIIRAVALAMRDVPASNASWYDDAIVQYTNVDVSVAVAIDGGLVTPVIKNADQKTLPQISGEMKALAKKARDGKLLPEEMQGGGFSVSNLGMFGIKSFSAIINPPQSCILAVGAGEQRVVVKNGLPGVATVMTVTLSVDHRSVDGAVGAQFLAAFKDYIESPVTMLV